jgi:hypothetical protein
VPASDGDKSPAKGGENSPHSKARLPASQSPRCAPTRATPRKEIPLNRTASHRERLVSRHVFPGACAGFRREHDYQKLNMTALNIDSLLEPSRDEIALNAFLAWEREGRQPNRETHYWLQAENSLRAERQSHAIAVAGIAAQPWPPVGATPIRKSPKPAAAKAPASVKAPAPVAPAPGVQARPAARTAIKNSR